jgi:hypothetical protein
MTASDTLASGTSTRVSATIGGLSAAELALLTERLELLRLTAQAELQIPDSNRG